MPTSDNPHELDHLRDRVRLYLMVMLVIDLGTEVAGGAMTLVLGRPDDLPFPAYFAIVRWSTTVVLAGSWLFVRYARPGRAAVVAVESGVTIGLGMFYVHFTKILPVYGPAFALLALALALVVRASLVPSPVARTVAIGVVSVAGMSVVAQRTLVDTQLPVAFWLTVMGGAFVVGTGVTSHVIYGLRRQVRDAMRLGQYELGRKLGEGGMGVVYEATHVMLRRPTAVKLLPVDKAGEQTVARFEREVQQTSRLEHPNSVFIYDYGRTPDGQFYYAMEYLDGVTLQQLVDIGGPVPPARAVHVVRQAANALAEAHAMGLVHRDIKPANIMLCERANTPDTVKVLDFGLVKAIDEADTAVGITQANSIVGTPHYLAPESIARPEDVGPPSDVYALGAIAFFLVTGREVFTGRTVVEVCSKHLNVEPESPSSIAGDGVPAALDALILRCLAKDPEVRPRDGADLASALDALALPGWTTAEARDWWSVHDDAIRARAPVAETATGRTQMAVDVGARQ